MWTLDELLECRQRFYPHMSQKQTENRFEQFGGVVRSVLADPGRSFERLARSLSALEAVDLYRLGAAALKSAIRHAFAHIEVSQLEAKEGRLIADHSEFGSVFVVLVSFTLDGMHICSAKGGGAVPGSLRSPACIQRHPLTCRRTTSA